MSPASSESSELYEAMRSYTAAAFELLSKQCPEGPPELLYFLDEWKRDSDGRFRLYDRSHPYWVSCIFSNRDALHSLDEYRRLVTVLHGTSGIAEQMDQMVGTAVEAMLLEAHFITDRLIWSLARNTGGLRFDEQVFKEQFQQLTADLKRSEFSYIVLVPLLGMTTESLPIALEPNVEIDRMTDGEIVRCLGLRMLPPSFHNISTTRIADVPSSIAIRVRYYLPKRVGERSEVAPNPIINAAQDLAVDVLHALRVFKQPSPRHPLPLCGINSTVFGKYLLDQHPEPHGASSRALNARESAYVNPTGYIGPTRSASFPTEVNNALTWFGLCGGSSAKPWCDRLVADVAAYHSDIKAGKRDQLRATGLP